MIRGHFLKKDKNQNIIVIIGNGEPLKRALLQEALAGTKVIIAADGGANNCRRYGIEPDYVIGDFDSIEQESLVFFKKTEVIHNLDQYSTDLEKALQLADSMNPDLIRFVSVFGYRYDHSMANLLFIKKKSVQTQIEVYDNFGVTRVLLAGRHSLSFSRGQLISLFSTGPVQNLTLEGFRYNLQNHSEEDFFIGVSNVAETDKCVISFDSGILFYYEVRDTH